MESKQIVAAVAVACALLCGEKKKKRLRRRTRSRPHLFGCGQYGLTVLQRQLELNDRTGFRELLRMTAEEFDFLLERVSPLISKQDTKLRKAITARERLSVTLRFLATGESFTLLGFKYHIGRSTVSDIVTTTCEALHKVLKEDYLKTPTSEDQWGAIAKDFYEKWHFPNCLGAVDGKRIFIQPPAHSGSTSYNYKGRFSVVLMGIADANYSFTYVSVGCQGRLPDAGIFAHSDLHRAMDEGRLSIPPAEPLPDTNTVLPYVFLGDDAFPLRPDLMKPYSHRQLDHDQRVFNYRLSRARRVVENAFGILANRLRVFRTTICLEPDKVAKIALASVCLHNYLRRCRSEAYMPPALADQEDTEHQVIPGNWRRDGAGAFLNVPAEASGHPPQQAEDQRERLKQYFVSPEGRVPWQERCI